LRKTIGIVVGATALLLTVGGAAYATTPSHPADSCHNGDVAQTSSDFIRADVLNNSLNCNDILNHNNILGILSSSN
jgi:hypothetical protein